MRKIFGPLLLAFFLSASTAFAANLQVIEGKVVGVSDGDTLTVLSHGNEQHKVRLMGIDAPEKSQPFGQRAKQRLSDLAYGKQVSVEFSKRDRYKRIVGKISDRGRDVNLAMVESGMAWFYAAYQREQTPKDRELYAAAEDEARRMGRGLWADREPVTPWEFRRAKRGQ